MSEQVEVETLPNCDFCGHNKMVAQYDAKTITGPWANMCQYHYVMYRMFSTLGTGKGQRLVVKK